MTEQQLLLFGGAFAFVLLRKPTMGVIWLVSALFVIPEEQRIAALCALFLASLFIDFKKGG
jgi:hypothetical protein